MPRRTGDKRRSAIEACRDKRGRIRPELLVQRARDPKHAFHKSFIWNDSVAANKQRFDTAQEIIRSFKMEVVIEDQKFIVPYYVRDPSSRTSAYVTTTSIADKEASARLALQDELRRIEGAVMRGKALAATFRLGLHFQKLLNAVVKIRGRLDDLDEAA